MLSQTSTSTMGCWQPSCLSSHVEEEYTVCRYFPSARGRSVAVRLIFSFYAFAGKNSKKVTGFCGFKVALVQGGIEEIKRRFIPSWSMWEGCCTVCVSSGTVKSSLSRVQIAGSAVKKEFLRQCYTSGLCWAGSRLQVHFACPWRRQWFSVFSLSSLEPL